jgi:eukaryotic-like serine/threonine-protein kinase
MSSRNVAVALAAIIVIAGGALWLSRGSSPNAKPHYQPEIVGAFEAVERGALIGTPWVADDRVYLGAIRDTGLQPTGAVVCLDRASLKPLWTFDDDGKMLHMFSSPVLANGRLYIGEGMHANFDCHLYCLDAETGRKLWAHAAKSHIESTPVVVGDHVVFGAGDDGVVCIDASNGIGVWKLDRPAHVDTTPIVSDSAVFVGSGVSRRITAEPAVYAIEAGTGQVRWRTAMDLPVWATPTLSDSVLFVGLGNGRLLESPRPPETPAGALVALDASDGHERWRFRDCDAVFGQPAVNDRFVFVGSRDGKYYAIDRRTGSAAWKVDCGSPVVAGPIWAGDTLVVAPSGGFLRGLDPNTGQSRWEFQIPRAGHSEVRILAPPAIYRQADRFLLYVVTEIRSTVGSAAVLYVLRL